MREAETEDHKFKVSLDCRVYSRLTWITKYPVLESQNKKQVYNSVEESLDSLCKSLHQDPRTERESGVKRKRGENMRLLGDMLISGNSLQTW